MHVIRDKARGMLVSLAVGDALGAPVEFGYRILDMECPVLRTRFEDDKDFGEPEE